jgi:hypothetical protein
VLQHFPDARIAAVRPTTSNDAAGEADDANGEELKEDGTNP